MTLFLSSQGVIVQNPMFFTEFDIVLLASARVFRTKSKLIFDFCL